MFDYIARLIGTVGTRPKAHHAEAVLGRLAVIIGVILTLSLSVCAFDCDRDGVDEGMDICAMPIVTVARVILLPALSVVGRSADHMLGSESEPSPHLPDPPPKAAFAA